LELRDPRVRLKCEHDFMAIVLIVVCATIAGADDFVSIEAFAKAKQSWFRERLGLKLDNGIPSHDTLTRVFALLSPSQFQECFLHWVESMADTLRLKQIPIDGKTMRGSKRKAADGKCRAVHIVSAWASANGMTLAQVRTEEKSNEITAIPELLNLLDISGALVSIDAAGCQKEIAEQIVAGKGDYLLAVKENQPRLYEDIDRLAQAALVNEDADIRQHTVKEKGHGREEIRSCFVLTELASIRDRELWTGLKAVIGVVTSRIVNGAESNEVRYYISSRRASAKIFLHATRAHWGIENPQPDCWQSNNLCEAGGIGYHRS
jgi:predicted transposase YbfD/YdcC